MLGSISGPAANDLGSSSGVTNLPAIQRLEGWNQHKAHVEERLPDSSLHGMHFAYVLVPGDKAESRTQATEEEINKLQHRVSGSQELLLRFLKAKDKIPCPNLCTLRPVNGVVGLSRRIEVARTAYGLILQSYQVIKISQEALRAEADKVRERIGTLELRRCAIFQRLLAVAQRVEELAIRGRLAELYSEGREKNTQLIEAATFRFSWSEWEQRIRAMKSSLVVPLATPDKEKEGQDHQEYYSLLSETSSVLYAQKRRAENYLKFCDQLKEKLALNRQ